LAGCVSLAHTLVGQAHIRPASETVFQIPGALAMPDQNKFIFRFHGYHLFYKMNRQD
jgi:hypothetical protein